MEDYLDIPDHMLPTRDGMVEALGGMDLGHLVHQTGPIEPVRRAVPKSPPPRAPRQPPVKSIQPPRFVPRVNEIGAGVRGPTIFEDPVHGGNYELSTGNTIIFLRVRIRARENLSTEEQAQFQHLWLKIYGEKL